MNTPTEVQQRLHKNSPSGSPLSQRFSDVRQFSTAIAEPLSAEDCTIQSMPDASPIKWHLAHTTWFFETFWLKQQPNYKTFDSQFTHLFNSYYNAIGEPFPRPQRGLLSRPGLDRVLEYRKHVDQAVLERLSTGEGIDPAGKNVIEIGLQHEQQHQELMLTDLKHLLSQNPLNVVYRKDRLDPTRSAQPSSAWYSFDEGVCEVGHRGEGFCFDNELPRHRVFLEGFELSKSLVTCGEYLRFIDEGGYSRPEFWLSLGWQAVCEGSWRAPLYWREFDGRWFEFTLAGNHEVDPDRPVCHVSYFEADAFARWAGARLPTEFEWERASSDINQIHGSFADTLLNRGLAIHPCTATGRPESLYGNVWQWTSSPYSAYPGYAPPAGALGEYNGKFMCNQFVLRGGSCATHSSHVRATYRNFFPPEARWQFSGIRLAR